nr:hypothetical protein GCM10020093_092630 [Planobispora longispora]
MRRDADFAAVAARVDAFPEVEAVVREFPDVWSGKADLAVRLCATADRLEEECARNRPGGTAGAATDAEKEAVLDRLWDLPGVETVYLQDRDHLARMLRRHGPQGADGETAPRRSSCTRPST